MRPPSRFLSSTVRLVLVAAILAPMLASCDKRSDAKTESGNGRIVADEHGFTPSSVELAKGEPGSKAALTFFRTTDKTCATEVVIPDLGVKKDLPLGQAVSVEVPTDKARTFTFQCGMSMYKGTLLVK